MTYPNPAVGDFLPATIADLLLQPCLGDNNGSTPVTITNASQYYPFGSAAVTFTLPFQCRVRVVSVANILPASATAARYVSHSAYNAGPSVGTPTIIGQAAFLPTSAAAVASANNDGTVVLPAGQYTAYPAASRATGSNTDQITSGYCAVYFVGIA